MSICSESTRRPEDAVLQVLVVLRVFWAQRVNLQEKYDYPSSVRSRVVDGSCQRDLRACNRNDPPECLDWMIPMSEAHLRSILRVWRTHYNGGRPHSALRPGVPGPPEASVPIQLTESRHRLAAGALVLAKSVLGGLHHEYSIAATPATA